MKGLYIENLLYLFQLSDEIKTKILKNQKIIILKENSLQKFIKEAI